MMQARVWIVGRYWNALTPQGDTKKYSNEERVILRFNSHEEPEFFVAEPGKMYAGWLVAIPLKAS